MFFSSLEICTFMLFSAIDIEYTNKKEVVINVSVKLNTNKYEKANWDGYLTRPFNI